MKEVVFSACLSSEVAWESGGHGEFTLRALRALQSGIDGLTNQQFEQQVTKEFGPAPRQHARLYCAPNAYAARLLQPLVRSMDGPTNVPSNAEWEAYLAQTQAHSPAAPV
jgi:hypothetical protein